MRATASIRTEALVKRFPMKGPSPEEGADWATQLVATVRDRFRRMQTKNVLNGVSMEVGQGELFGLLGPNGAGKTTLIKLLTCLLYPDGGEGWVAGFDLRRERGRVKSAFSLVPAQGWLGTLFYLSLRDNLEFCARLSGLSRQTARSRIDTILERLELTEKSSQYLWSLSSGQLQKLNLARVYLLHTPVVFLDEPTAHLDPRAARAVRSFIQEVLHRELGQTVFMSTHDLVEAEAVCDRVGILDQGRMVACDRVAELKRKIQGARVVELKLEGYTPEMGQLLRATPGVREVFEQVSDGVIGQATVRVELREEGEPEVVLRALSDHAGRVRSVRQVGPSLEEVFFHHVGRRLQ